MAVGLAVAAAFGLGLVLRPKAEAPAASAGPGTPIVGLEPGELNLLPDASLRFQSPGGFDAGAR